MFLVGNCDYLQKKDDRSTEKLYPLMIVGIVLNLNDSPFQFAHLGFFNTSMLGLILVSMAGRPMLTREG